MGYLRRLVLVNSGGYPLADVRLDGHCDMAGGQGVGKTTLLNAILFPFVVDDQYLDIDTREKMRFSLYYFQSVNSFVIYEVINNKDVPYCILINRTGQALNFHFISAPFDMGWLYNGDEQVTSWQEVRQKLSELGIACRTEDRMWKFNNIFLGKGDFFSEQYSIVKTPKDKDAIRPLLSAIFKNKPFTQENLKETLVAAVMSTNNVETEGIELASHKSNLESFTQRYSDIRKMTVTDRNGHTAVSPIAEDIFSKVDRYYKNREERKLIPGLLLHSVTEASKKAEELDSLIESMRKEKAKAETDWKASDAELQEKLDAVNADRGGVRSELENIKSIEEQYREVDINDIVEWICDKKVHENDLTLLQKRYEDLTSDSRDAIEEMNRELEKLKVLYQHKQADEENRHNKATGDIQKRIGEVTAKAKAERGIIEKEYGEKLGADWRTIEMALIDALLDLSAKLSTAETVEDVRESLNAVPDIPELEPILVGILTRRNGADISTEDLRSRVSGARMGLEEELDKKVLLEKEKNGKLADVDAMEKKELKKLKEEQESEDSLFGKQKQRIVQEHDEKAQQIRSDYEAGIHGDDDELKATLEDLNDRIESERHVLECVEKYPAAEVDKTRYLDRKPELVEKRDKLNAEYRSILDKKNADRKAHDEKDRGLGDDIRKAENELRSLKDNIGEAKSTLARRSDFRAAYDAADPIENDQNAKDILNRYEDIRRAMEELREDIPSSVQRLYAPDMLSRVDTFQLGISRNDSLSTFDEFLSVAEKLRARLENSDEEMGLDWYVRLNTDIWLNEIRDISTAMSPVENMLMQIQRLCRKATDFVRKNNKTDCVDDFTMSVNEKDTTDLVRMLREITRFYNDKNVVLGFDNLFSGEDEPANKKAIELLERFADELERCGDQRISLTSMFDIRMDITEKGNVIKNVLSFNNPGSNGTALVLKAMLNMTLLHIFLQKNQADNTRLICAIDEMNTISAHNLDVLTDFASEAGMFLFGSGQNHTKAVLDYSYNVYDMPAPDGTRIKDISMDAMQYREEEDEILE